MNEDRFNMDIRKFLKVVGVTSQREIELAVRNALAAGKLAETSLLKPKVTLRIPEIVKFSTALCVWAPHFA